MKRPLVKRLGAELAAVALFTALAISGGLLGASKIHHAQAQARAARAQAAELRVVPTGSPAILARLFPKAQATSDQRVYLADDGNSVSESDFDQASPAYRRFVLTYLREHGGSLVHSQCFAVYSKNADGETGWSAGYCVNTVLKRYGPTPGPKA